MPGSGTGLRSVVEPDSDADIELESAGSLSEESSPGDDPVLLDIFQEDYDCVRLLQEYSPKWFELMLVHNLQLLFAKQEYAGSTVSFQFEYGFCCRMERINFLIREIVSWA